MNLKEKQKDFMLFTLGRVSQVTYGSGRLCKELNRPGQPDGFESPPRPPRR